MKFLLISLFLPSCLVIRYCSSQATNSSAVVTTEAPVATNTTSSSPSEPINNNTITMATLASPTEMMPASSTPSDTLLSQLSGPTNEFALDFLSNLQRTNDKDNVNVLFSPLSIALAYGMLMEGAAGETEKQIIDVLKLSSIGSTAQVTPAIKKLLEGYKKVEDGSSDRNFSMAIGNLAMVSAKAKLKEPYAQSLINNYFAQATNEDFENNGTAVMNKLNGWVAEKTHGKITKLLNSPPDEETILMLVNALYFKGKWVEPFPKTAGWEDTFNNGDGSTSKVKMMAIRDKKFNYQHNPELGVKLVEIPYHGNVSMIVMMPTESNTLSSLHSNLSSSKLNELIGSMTSTKLRLLALPKFKLEGTHKLHQILPTMGMSLPFTDSAELPNIAEKSELKVSQSLHKALLEVDEEGSVAAAATLIVTVLRMSYFPAEDFIADRPFIFIIRDNLTGINLFTGQMNKMVPLESQPVASSTEMPMLPTMAEPQVDTMNVTNQTMEPTMNVTKQTMDPPMNKTA